MTEHNFASLRAAMIASQLRTVAVDDARLLAALHAVPREQFVPPARRALAYTDSAVPLSADRALNTPLATARLIDEAQVTATDHVLVVGAASGYAAALLARMAASVVALEEDAALFAMATETLSNAANVRLSAAPLTAGVPEAAPFDAIIIDGAIESLPDALVAQLAIGGRLTCAYAEDGVIRLSAGRRTAGGFALLPFVEAAAVPLPGFAKPRVFQF